MTILESSMVTMLKSGSRRSKPTLDGLAHTLLLCLLVSAPGCGGPPETGVTGGAATTTTSSSSTGGSGGIDTTSSAAGGSGGATCVPANDENPCTNDICDGGMAVHEPVAAGTALPAQVAGDCKKLVCDGDGAVTQQDDDSDLADDSNFCTEDVCAAGVPSHPIKPQGTICGMAMGNPLFCDTAGMCVGCNAPADCFGSDDECKTRTCTSGVCGVSFTPANSPIAAQTMGDCLMAVCDGAGHVVDIADDIDLPADDGNACTDEVCSAGLPAHAAKADGTVCNDGDACTTVDACQAGTCTGGAEVVCVPLGPCHSAGTCDAFTGICSNPVDVDGSLCDDGNACTLVDICKAGACLSGPPKACGAGLACVAGACVDLTCSGTVALPAPPATVAGHMPTSAATADFNGDNVPDVAVANEWSNTVSVHMNLGDGTLAPAVQHAVANSPIDVMAADLNGDGFADIVAIGASVSVLMNQGNGTFAPAVNYYVGNLPLFGTTADLNGDGYIDLAIPVYNDAPKIDTATVLFNQGNGTFGSPVHFPAGGERPRSMAAADMNGDGKPDLAVANFWTHDMSVLLNQGNGSFAGAVVYPAGMNPGSLAAADMNGDGKPDLAVTNNESNSVRVFVNQGNAVFAAPVLYNVPGYLDRITARDLNGDGKPDLALEGGKGLAVLLNQGNGVFAPEVDYAVRRSPSGVSVADMNGDSAPDLATAGSYTDSVSVLFNQGGGVFASIPYPARYAVNEDPRSVTAADLNSDGKTDLAIAFGRDAGIGTTFLVSVLLNQGNGIFAAKVDYQAGSNPTSITSADLNGDGEPDLAVANRSSGNVSVLVNLGNGIFGPPSNYAVGSAPSSIVAADLNGDGKPDLAAGNGGSNTVSVLLNLGGGTFAGKVDYAAGGSPRSLAAADLNGDGGVDLAAGTSSGVRVLLNLGNGSFGVPASYAAGASPQAIVAVNLNGDSAPDLAVANKDSNDVSVLLNQGNGSFAAAVNYAAGPTPSSLSAVDLNSDGKPDLAVTNLNIASASVLLNQGNGTFAPRLQYDAFDSPVSITGADLNGDGRADLAVANDLYLQPGYVSVLLNECLP